MKDLRYVDLLIAHSQRVYEQLSQEYLCSYKLAHHDQGERLISDPGGKPNYAMYRAFAWEGEAGNRLVWFSLESHIPHMSSITAFLGFPPPGSNMPMLVVNMNLKRHLGSYGTILGVRGNTESITKIDYIPTTNPDSPAPLIIKENPEGFSGVRLIFELTDSAIEWSFKGAERALSGWFKKVLTAKQSCLPYSEETAMEDSAYGREMTALHADGGVFDAVFGDKWVAELFSECVFGKT